MSSQDSVLTKNIEQRPVSYYTEENKPKQRSDLMSPSDSMKRAIKKYNTEKVERIFFRVPKGKKELIQDYAEKHGESLSHFINRAIDQAMEKE